MKAKKRLYRNKRDAMFGGVCAGVADYLDADPTIIRLIWVLATFLWGAGLIVYLVGWLIMPIKYK